MEKSRGYASRTRILAWLCVVVFAGTLGVIRYWFPERPADYVGPRAFLDAGFALGLLALVLIVAAGLGRIVLRALKVQSLTISERLLFSLVIGLGIVAYGVLALGLVGLLRWWSVGAWLMVGAVVGARGWGKWIARLPELVSRVVRGCRGLQVWQNALLFIGLSILALSVVQALAPPWSYDALMYHLEGPRRFLEAGRIAPDPDRYRLNYPFTIEMLYVVGLAFGSDVFARLIHLTLAVMLVIGTFLLGRRYLGEVGGWLAGALLLGIPIFSIWSVIAYSDMGWALFELTAVYSLLLWSEQRARRWLVLSAVFAGFALGTKYLALGGVGVIGLWVLLRSRRSGLRRMLTDAVLFGGVALLVASPWYLKNWVGLGNPVYPAFFGGAGWSGGQAEWFEAYHASFGMGKSLKDFIALPWNIYARRELFTTVGGTTEVPNPLFLLALFYPLFRQRQLPEGIGWFTLARTILWFFGCQQPRLLLPAFPLFSLLVAAEFCALIRRARSSRWWYLRALVSSLVGGVLVVTAICTALLFNNVRPVAVVAGVESKESFLARSVRDYTATQFIQTVLPLDAKVMFMWDGRAYYCDERCWPDQEQGRWMRISATGNVLSVAASLNDEGVTHLLFSIDDVSTLLGHDPDGTLYESLLFYVDEFEPLCTEVVYSTESARLVELTCP